MSGSVYILLASAFTAITGLSCCSYLSEGYWLYLNLIPAVQMPTHRWNLQSSHQGKFGSPAATLYITTASLQSIIYSPIKHLVYQVSRRRRSPMTRSLLNHLGHTGDAKVSTRRRPWRPNSSATQSPKPAEETRRFHPCPSRLSELRHQGFALKGRITVAN